MKKSNLLLCFAFLAIFTSSCSDENGDPLIGVNILVENSTVGTISNLDGTYEINIPNGSNQLTNGKNNSTFQTSQTSKPIYLHSHYWISAVISKIE